MSMAIGCDETAFEMKETIKNFLIDRDYEVEDFDGYNTEPVLFLT